MNHNNFKTYLHFTFKVPSPPPMGATGEEGAGAMGAEPHTKKIKWHVNSGVFKSGSFKNNLHFSLRVPSGISSQGTRRHLRTKPPSLTQGCPIDECEATLKGK